MSRPSRRPNNFNIHLQKLNLRLFNFYYTSEYRVTYHHYILSQPQHPLFPVFNRRYQERERSGLWWCIATGNALSPKKVVRTWVGRRMRNAFVEELKQRGYDKDGKVLQPRSNDSESGNKILQALDLEHPENDLEGSLRMHPLPAIITAKYEEVRTEVRSLVDALVKGRLDSKGQKAANTLRTANARTAALDNPGRTVKVTNVARGRRRAKKQIKVLRRDGQHGQELMGAVG